MALKGVPVDALRIRIIPEINGRGILLYMGSLLPYGTIFKRYILCV